MAEHRGHTSLQTKWESKSTAASSTENKIKRNPPLSHNNKVVLGIMNSWHRLMPSFDCSGGFALSFSPEIIIFFQIRSRCWYQNMWRVWSFFSSEGMVTNPENWLVLFAVRIFLSLPTGTVTLSWVAEYILGFVVIFHKYISFFRQYFQNKDISHDLEIINVLSILPLSRLQNTLPLIYMSLRKNNVYCFMPRTSKPPDTCKWGGPKWKSILQLLPLFSLSRITLVAIKKLVSKLICGRKMSLNRLKSRLKNHS